ncbi:MAG: hypothetical protein IJ840_01650 [Bacteroidales bacterium]|nr:hypothetical protein [Bacteroidales bacterium]
MKKSDKHEGLAYVAPEIEQIIIDSTSIMAESVPGGGMDNPSPEDPD